MNGIDDKIINSFWSKQKFVLCVGYVAEHPNNTPWHNIQINSNPVPCIILEHPTVK